MLLGHASGCWLSALGTGMAYNREQKQWHIFDINSQPSSDSSLTKVPSLQTTGSPQGTGFPSTSGKNSGTFGAALRGALRELGNFLKTSTFFLRVSPRYVLFAGTVPPRCVLFAGTVTPFN